LSYRDKTRFEYAGAAGGLLDRNGYPYCRGRVFASVEADHGQYDDNVEVAWASGAAMMVRTAVYRRLGGLDERFFAHMEEIDLCCRMIGAGHKVYAVGECRVYHVGGASLNQGDPRKTYLNFRNNLLLMHKNLPEGVGRGKLFMRRLLDTLAWLMFMLKLDFSNANAILRAHADFRRMKKFYTSFPDHDILATLPGASRNILVDYYLRRRVPRS
jgi:GT2 family glycosyltransferase